MLPRRHPLRRALDDIIMSICRFWFQFTLRREDQSIKERTMMKRKSVQRICVAFAVTATGVATHLKAFAQDNAERTRRFEAPYCKLDFGRSLVKIPDSRHLVDGDYSALPKPVQSGLYDTIVASFREAKPFVQFKFDSPPNATVRIYAAFAKDQDDIVELSWKYHGQNLRLTSSINAMRLDIDLDEVGRNSQLDQFGLQRLDRVRGLVAAIVSLQGRKAYGEDYQIELPWPDTLEEGVTFCFNPNQSIRTLMRWYQRIDAFVHDGVLSILVYKHIPQMMTYKDGSKWFPDDFRAMIHERARAQGKLPPPTESETP